MDGWCTDEWERSHGPILVANQAKGKKKKHEQMLQSTTATNVINPSIQWALIKKNSLSL
jgi:hypothetical protein